MPFYELVCISRARLNPNMLSDMLRLSATTIINGGGVVRGFQNLGEHDLPYRMKRHQVYHTRGRYWLMHFDANPSTLNELSEKLRVDQRVIRHTMIKLGDTLPTIIDRPDKTHMI